MNRKTFISEFTAFIQKAVRLCEKARTNGLLSLEDELEDLDDEDFKQGMRLAVDGYAPEIIDEIFSNKIAFEKDKYARRYKTIVKRTILAIQSSLNSHIFIHILFSHANLPQKEQQKIEHLLLSMEENREYKIGDPQDLIIDGSYENAEIIEEAKTRLYDCTAIVRLDDRAIQKIIRELDSVDLAKALKAAGKEARKKIFSNLSKHAGAMIMEEMEYMGQIRLKNAEEAHQKIIAIISRLAETGEINE